MKKGIGKIVVCVELVAVVILIIMGFFTFNIVKNKVQEQVKDFVNEFDNDKIMTDIMTGESMIWLNTGTFTDALSKKIEGSQAKNEWTKYQALYLRTWGMDEKNIVELDGKFIVISCFYGGNKYISFNLYDYFSEEEIEKFLDNHYKFLKLDSEKKQYSEVTNLKGYVAGMSRIIPTEIEFVGKDGERYTIKADTDKEGGDLFGGSLELGSFSPSVEQDKIGNIFVYVMNSDKSCTENLHSLVKSKLGEEWIDRRDKVGNERSYMEDDFAYTTGRFAGSEFYEAAYYADVTAITLHNPIFIQYILYEIIILQLFAFVVIFVYYDIRKKQKKEKQSRDMFINAMAHELKTPAAVIQNTAEYVQTGMKPEKLEHYMEMQKKEAVKLNTLLSSMLEYTRFSNKDVELKKVELDLATINEEVLSSYRNAIDEKNISVEVTNDSVGKKTVIGDDRLIEMVIDNLVSNAAKYANDGGKINIKISDGRYEIINSGAQIQDEDKEAVFTPMYRVEKARKADGSSGMGLAISNEIIKLHSGQIGCENTSDGVRFFFSI